MQRHTKLYFDAHNIDYDEQTGWHDFIACKVCGMTAQDLHHIEKRIKGVKRLDEPDNIIPLCRSCHDKAHAGVLTKNFLKQCNNQKKKKLDKL